MEVERHRQRVRKLPRAQGLRRRPGQCSATRSEAQHSGMKSRISDQNFDDIFVHFVFKMAPNPACKGVNGLPKKGRIHSYPQTSNLEQNIRQNVQKSVLILIAYSGLYPTVPRRPLPVVKTFVGSFLGTFSPVNSTISK